LSRGRLAALLANMAVHKLDLIIADRAMPSHLSVRATTTCWAKAAGVFAAPPLVRG
jgi:LysR family transcriptional activator of nhaA